MKWDTFNRLGKYIQLIPKQRQLFGNGAGEISTIGSIKIQVLIDESNVNLTFQKVVIGDITCIYEAILGKSIFKQFKERVTIPVNEDVTAEGIETVMIL